MRFPLGKAAAIPMLMSLRLMMLVPETETLIMGKSLIALATASMKIGVKVKFSPSRFLKSFFMRSRHLTMVVTSAST